ncbi:phenylacetate--CoA ligase family protein [Natranaeroarchaeum aerophilus]|uniref:Phenylacetate--CoA ligase family protein n=1 Tax=Natranaeroarchaeum aerophilus TaxID=2917711 RepID=A0AAE3FSX7_9EURY|nr:hypothetical protein [Natranaeroarchaeum aerophilus]MCL9815002.1 hypothetical protein [Natranaeroarchaeum aerophilus]
MNAQIHRLRDGPYGDSLAPDVDAVSSWDEFRELPLTTATDVNRAVAAAPVPSDLATISYTALDGTELPVHDTLADEQYMAAINAKYFQQAGFRPGDRVLNCFPYTATGGGEVFEKGLRALGAEVVPASDATASTLQTLLSDHLDGLCGPPSTVLAMEEDVSSGVDIFLGAGEPFTGIPGRRSKVKERLGAETAVDYFGTRHAQPIAVESAAEDGLMVCDDYVLVEIVDHNIGQTLPAGTYGEVVITHLHKTGTPLFRCRTGDVARLTRRDGNPCLPDSIVGSRDESVRVSDRTVYKAGLRNELLRFEGPSGDFEVETHGDSSYSVVYEGADHGEDILGALEATQPVAPTTVRAVDD